MRFWKSILLILTVLLGAGGVGLLMNGNALPPIGLFYGAVTDGQWWLGWLGTLTRFGVGFSLFLIALAKMAAIEDHHSEALRRRARSIANMFMVTAVWTSTVAAFIEWGGVWHFISLIFGVFELVMTLHTLGVVVQTHEEIKKQAHD